MQKERSSTRANLDIREKTKEGKKGRREGRMEYLGRSRSTEVVLVHGVFDRYLRRNGRRIYNKMSQRKGMREIRFQKRVSVKFKLP